MSLPLNYPKLIHQKKHYPKLVVSVIRQIPLSIKWAFFFFGEYHRMGLTHGKKECT